MVCFSYQDERGGYTRERVVEVYGATAPSGAGGLGSLDNTTHTHTHTQPHHNHHHHHRRHHHHHHHHNTTTTTTTNNNNNNEARPQSVVDPSILTSLDLESDVRSDQQQQQQQQQQQHTYTDNMLVTNSPPSSPHHHHSSSRTHHNNTKNKGNSTVVNDGSRANKYLVDEVDDATINSHLNLGYDGSPNLSYENPRSSCRENFGYDPGYASERSPDEEDMPNMYERLRGSSEETQTTEESSATPSSPIPELPGGVPLNLHHLMQVCPFINDATMFEVTVIKNSRGLGLAVTGGMECDAPWAGLIRIKKIYPQTSAWLCGQLHVGDIILEANDHFLTGLTSHEALEVLRTTGTEVLLKVCRPPSGTLGDCSESPCGTQEIPVVTTSLTAPHISSQNLLSPSSSLSHFGEFQIKLTKVKKSLGFTLRKQDNSILGHTIRSLVKEPAISDGRLRSGDKILSVNGTDMCGLSHEEAVSFLRTCPETTTLRLYRDAMQTPVSPVSPSEPEAISKPKMLRHEARAMLTDIAFRKQSSPSNSPSLAGGGGSCGGGGGGGSPSTPRRRRLQKTPSPDLKKNSTTRKTTIDGWNSVVDEVVPSPMTSPPVGAGHHPCESPFGNSQTESSVNSSEDGTGVSRTNSASSCNSNSSLTNLSSKSKPPQRPSFLDLSGRQHCPRKSQFTPPHEMEKSFPSPCQYQSIDSLDSVPRLTSTHSDTPAFGHLHQGYQSINLGGTLHGHDDPLLLSNTTSDHNLSSHTESTNGDKKSGLLKWKGIVFTPDDEEDNQHEDIIGKTNDNLDGYSSTFKSKIITLEMNRGWNSRLGFSIQPRDDKTVIIAIYADSVAARDGRLKIGDQVLKVNGIDVSTWKTDDIIELLRKTRGKIAISVLQRPF